MSQPVFNQLVITTAAQNLDLISAVLIQQQVQGIETLPNDQGLAIYLPAQMLNQQWCQQLQEELKQWGIAADQYELHLHENVDVHWGKYWQKYYQPVTISHFLKIVPAWQTGATPAATEILMRPQEAFGTGEHPTTKLCLQALELFIHGQKSLIDVGTGTGILAIAAAKFGVKELYGYDLSAEAVTVAQENFALNQLASQFQVQQNSLLTGVQQTAEVLVANMLLEPLTALMPQINDHLNTSGLVIVSGFLVEQAETMKELLQQQHLVIVQELISSGWSCLVAQKEQG